MEAKEILELILKYDDAKMWIIRCGDAAVLKLDLGEVGFMGVGSDLLIEYRKHGFVREIGCDLIESIQVIY